MFETEYERRLQEVTEEEDENEQKLLIPWIVDCLNQRRFRDFHWYNKKKKIFQVPWSHKSANHWSPDCVSVPAAWAKYKGKYVDRKDDYKKLKSTFRCAMNSRRELTELKDRRTKRYRYWMLLPDHHLALAAKKPVISRAKTKQSCKEISKKSVKRLESCSSTQSQLSSFAQPSEQDFSKIVKRRGRPKKQPVKEAQKVEKSPEYDSVMDELQFLSFNTDQMGSEGTESVNENADAVILPPFQSLQRYQEACFPPSPPQDHLVTSIPSSSSYSNFSLHDMSSSVSTYTSATAGSNFCADTTTTYNYYNPTHEMFFRDQSDTPPPDYLGGFFDWTNDQTTQAIHQSLFTINTDDLESCLEDL